MYHKWKATQWLTVPSKKKKNSYFQINENQYRGMQHISALIQNSIFPGMSATIQPQNCFFICNGANNANPCFLPRQSQIGFHLHEINNFNYHASL